MKIMKLTAAAAVILGATFALPTFASTTNASTQNANGINVQKLIKATQSTGLRPKVLKQALNGYLWAKKHGKVQNSNVLTVVDLSMPSSKKRLWVIDLKNDTVLMQLHTAQGKNSGVFSATHVSNVINSKESSAGIFQTSNTYFGKHGLSERLNGLEKGINNNARVRAIVIHPANYVTPAFIKAHNRTGRSWGCFAVNPQKSKSFINLVKGGSVIYAYAKAENSDPIVNDGPVELA